MVVPAIVNNQKVTPIRYGQALFDIASERRVSAQWDSTVEWSFYSNQYLKGLFYSSNDSANPKDDLIISSFSKLSNSYCGPALQALMAGFGPRSVLLILFVPPMAATCRSSAHIFGRHPQISLPAASLRSRQCSRKRQRWGSIMQRRKETAMKSKFRCNLAELQDTGGVAHSEKARYRLHAWAVLFR